MPQIAATTVLQLALLLSALPAQYLISRWSGSTVAQRFHAITRLRGIWREWKASYLNSTAWSELVHEHMSKVRSLIGLGEGGQVSPEFADPEWTMLDNDHGYFGASRAVRSPRPLFVFLRVGEVVRERKANMVGVVIGWDAELRAPPEWLNKVYSDHEEAKALHTPHYKVIFHGPGAKSVLIAYLPQTQLERITDVELTIPTLEKYFTHFNGKQFVMQSWLREMYPDDEVEDEEETWLH
ncbi:uncharacterized protein si:dkey-261l7.2 [Gadus macrocephalus]|uniref:uncharacterized protein si:dkey-261l7.2 n=1 Tax=Gadus macrocephalus TaxID=80720 RepID=UPI0028CB4CAC|nr:uncharacterized protein si:dkey-261l7.2 [Gadus macrocephalus]XP_059898061.1 uncharacterized protein si:dkey-261l7.2 [Gadus macrocephalus]